MDKSTVIRTGVAGAVAAAGLVVGGTAIASADDQPSASSETQSAARGPGGHGGKGGPGIGVRDAAAFAKALDVSEDDLTAAFKAVREDLKGDKSADGDRVAREVRQAALAAALAEELDISPDTVTSALEDLRSDATADRRTKLSERLDTAVDGGDLTDTDKASVLKAFDAGVLGAPR